VGIVYRARETERERQREGEREREKETKAHVGVAKRAMDECCLVMIMTA